MTIRKLLPVFLIVAVLLFAALLPPAIAQEVTETPTAEVTEPALETPTAEPTALPTPEPPVEPPEELPPTPPEDVLSRLLALLDNATYIVWAAAGVVIITGAIKTLAYLAGIRIEGVGAALLALAVQVIIWILYSIANALGAGEAFRTQYEIVVEVIRSLLPLVGSIFGGHVLYQAAASRRVPVLGFYPPPKYKAQVEGKNWPPPSQQ